jgi:hypothetical protein
VTIEDGAASTSGPEPSDYRTASDDQISAEHAEWRRTRAAALLQISGAGIAVLEAAGSAIVAMTDLLRTYQRQLEAEGRPGPVAGDAAEPDGHVRGRRRIDVSD